MADENKAADVARTDALREERGAAKKREKKAKRQEMVRGAQLKAIKRAQKESGRAGKIIGGTAADVGVQAPIAVGRGALEAGEKVLDVVTGGAYTPIDIATTIGGSVFQKGAGKAAKYGIGRPGGKQVGKAPFRPVVAMQKRRVKAAKKRGERAKAERRAIDKELTKSEGAPERLGKVLAKGLIVTTFQVVAIPIEIALSLIMAILFPIVLLLLGWYLVVVILPDPIIGLLSKLF